MNITAKKTGNSGQGSCGDRANGRRRDCLGFRIHRAESGFTLLEALIAVAVLAIVMLGTATMLFSGLSASAGSNNRYTATTIAQSTMEGLMARPFDSLSSHLAPVATSSNGVQYQYRWRISDLSANLRFFNISTTWRDKAGTHGISIAGTRAR